MLKPPRVTVLMSVYNGERHLARSIRSILDQSFTDFELLIIDDGSSDLSRSIVESFADHRIKLVSRENRGLTVSLNEGLALARGEYVARQDADDFSLPGRLEEEVALLDRRQDVALVGTNYTIIDDDDRRLATTSVFTHPDDLAVAEIVSNQYGHGSVMFRKTVVDQLGGYDRSVGHVEDYDLFVRIGRVARLANIGRPLYVWRRRSEGVTLSNRETQIAQALSVRDREFQRVIDRRADFRIYSSFHPLTFFPSPVAYLRKKAALFRDLSYLYRGRGLHPQSIVAMLAAIAHAPWERVSYLRLYGLLRDRSETALWEFEWL
jgi:glycosyltransferase involved in cell wall biosynthesis